MEFVKRENEILLSLKRFVEAELDFVVVGGYAVSGLGKHRFSVDCDVVIPKSEIGETEELLQRCGFERNVEKTGFDETYAGGFLSYKKKVGELPVTFDLLVGSLVCRTTGAAGMTCPTCGGPLRYIQQYQRWYCDREGKYV